MTTLSVEASAIQRRNASWRSNPAIPRWVDISSVTLDQFFTADSVAEMCFADLKQFMQEDGADPDGVTFLEPSAGKGAFLKLLPEKRRVALDILPQTRDTIEADFLSWQPEPSDLPTVVIGNPPFGYRAWLALQFLNHAGKFADYVGFILPMAFQSDGKGSPKLRVRGMHLVRTMHLPQNSFVDSNGRSVKVNALWQIWKRGERPAKPVATCNDWIDLFTVDLRKERLCGHERMGEADFFLQRTFYREAPTLVTKFSDVRYVCGYGMVIKRDRELVIEILQQTDWHQYSNLAAHNCHHISMYHIRKALTDAGLHDA